MLIKKLLLKLLPISLLLFILGSSCVTIQNRNACAVNGKITLGATCSGTITGATTQLSMDQTLEMIEASPTHPAAIFQSASDYTLENKELQEACRELGAKCTYQMKSAIEKSSAVIENIQSAQGE